MGILCIELIALQIFSPSRRSPELGSPNPLEAKLTPHKKRKHSIHKSSATVAAQQNALLRQQAQALRAQELQLQFGSNINTGNNRVVVNTGKADDQAFIYVNPHIGADIKPHQIEGVQFMWREIVSAGDSDASGCLLAHTMGLGKTMQA